MDRASGTRPVSISDSAREAAGTKRRGGHTWAISLGSSALKGTLRAFGDAACVSLPAHFDAMCMIGQTPDVTQV